MIDEIPDDWMVRISDEEWREFAYELAKLAIQIPSIKNQALELIQLIYPKDQEVKEVRNGNGRT